MARLSPLRAGGFAGRLSVSASVNKRTRPLRRVPSPTFSDAVRNTGGQKNITLPIDNAFSAPCVRRKRQLIYSTLR